MKNNFYIEFKILEPNRTDKLLKIFNELKLEKVEFFENEKETNSSEEKWLKYLDSKSHKWFFENIINTEEKEVYWKLWKLTKPEIRLNHPFFVTGQNWNFSSMIETILNCEYELENIEIEKNKNIGKLIFEPFSYPFGGSESLIELIESFGNEIIYDSWNEGKPNKKVIGWEYQVAQKLVKENKGLEFLMKIKTQNNPEKTKLDISKKSTILLSSLIAIVFYTLAYSFHNDFILFSSILIFFILGIIFLFFEKLRPIGIGFLLSFAFSVIMFVFLFIVVSSLH